MSVSRLAHMAKRGYLWFMTLTVRPIFVGLPISLLKLLGAALLLTLLNSGRRV